MSAATVLIVDDEPDVVSILSILLNSEGYRVLKAYDGISAVDLALHQRPDLILLDLMMPAMSGYEVCEQLKANPSTEDIPVLCITSAHSPSARAQCLKVGAATLLEKPFPPMELIAQVERYLPQATG